VTIVVRGDSLAESMSQYLVETVEEAPNVDVRTGTEIAAGEGNGRLELLSLRTGTTVETVPAAALVILIGAHPRTDWLPPEIERDENGYVVTGAAAGSSRMTETSVPGVFAAGDVRAGSVKRVAAAVGDGALAVTDVHNFLAEKEASGWPARS
jgi:thioredoxin reductase (NADPH)